MKKFIFFGCTPLLFSLVIMVNLAQSVPYGWPSNIKGDDGFRNLGKAISSMPDFPKYLYDVEKARYIYSLLPEIARDYNIRAARADEGLKVWLQRREWFWARNDPEGADSLKGEGMGHCGEHSYAFLHILEGAKVMGRVVFADRDNTEGKYSSWHAGTDTTVIVYEKTFPDGKISRRVFDAYRAYYSTDYLQPTEDSIKEWGDLPLTPHDYLPRDFKAKRKSWLEKVGKSFIKNAETLKLLGDVPPARLSSYGLTSMKEMESLRNKIKDNKVGSGYNISGFWECKVDNDTYSYYKVFHEGKKISWIGYGRAYGQMWYHRTIKGEMNPDHTFYVEFKDLPHSAWPDGGGNSTGWVIKGSNGNRMEWGFRIYKFWDKISNPDEINRRNEEISEHFFRK